MAAINVNYRDENLVSCHKNNIIYLALAEFRFQAKNFRLLSNQINYANYFRKIFYVSTIIPGFALLLNRNLSNFGRTFVFSLVIFSEIVSTETWNFPQFPVSKSISLQLWYDLKNVLITKNTQNKRTVQRILKGTSCGTTTSTPEHSRRSKLEIYRYQYQNLIKGLPDSHAQRHHHATALTWIMTDNYCTKWFVPINWIISHQLQSKKRTKKYGPIDVIIHFDMCRYTYPGTSLIFIVSLILNSQLIFDFLNWNISTHRHDYVLSVAIWINRGHHGP